jgi:hypothetical protein
MDGKGLGYGMHLLEELLASLAADGATVGQFDEYRRRWAAAGVAPGVADPAAQAPCPLCFRGGRTALLRAIAGRGPYDGAACLTCGNEFYWKAED